MYEFVRRNKLLIFFLHKEKKIETFVLLFVCLLAYRDGTKGLEDGRLEVEVYEGR